MEPMMTARQVAELLGVHENWVYDQAVAGELPSYKLGGARRFDPKELRGWIAEHREAKRRRQTASLADRAASVPVAARRDAEHRQRGPEPERPKRPRRRKSRPAAAETAEPQPKLFETESIAETGANARGRSSA